MDSDDFSPRFLLITTIALLAMIGPFSIDTYLPSFPAIESDFAVNRATLNQTIALYLVASALSTLFWGPLSDRIGRRRVILGTVFLYILASLACALSQNYLEFLLFRVMQGISASGGMVAGRAMIRDAHGSRGAHRAMAYVMMVFALAPAIAPVIGAWLHDAFGWRSVFYFLALFGAVILLMSLRILDETLAREQRQSIRPASIARLYMQVLWHRRFLMLVLALGSGFGGLFLYIAGSPTIVFDFLGLEEHSFALQFIPMTSGIIAGSYLSGRLTRRYSSSRIIVFAFVILGFASGLNLTQALWMESTPFVVIAPLVLYAFGIAMALPGFSMMSIDCFPQNRGAAAAVQSFMQVMISALVASLLLPMVSFNLLSMTLGQACCLAASFAFWKLTGYREVR